MIPHPVTTIEKTMTLSAGEFAKSLAAFADGDVTIIDGHARIDLEESGGTAKITAEITYEPLPSRRVGGLLELPQAKVTVRLTGMTAEQADIFLRRFDIAFQRGGG